MRSIAVALCLISMFAGAQEASSRVEGASAKTDEASKPKTGASGVEEEPKTKKGSEASESKSKVDSKEGKKKASGKKKVSGGLDASTYRVRLRDLEQRVDELKEQIRRSHTRLSLLSDTILSGASGGARAEIEFINDLSGAWHVVEAIFVLDGAVQYKKTDDTGALAKQHRIPIFNGTVPSGDHTLQVMLKLRGHGYGVFSYLRGIEAKVTSDHSFTLTDGKVLKLVATAWEQGGATTPVEEQPAIRFQQTIRSGGGTAGAHRKKSKVSSAPAKLKATSKSGRKKSSK